MRIIIDLQGAQGTNRLRGIGRYCLSIAKAIIRNSGKHEVILVLNGQFKETIAPIRTGFSNLLPQDNIRLWYPYGSVESLNKNIWYREVAELVREAFIESLKPDIVLVSSLFEGLSDNVVTGIHKLSNKTPTVTLLYDLIPLIHRKNYLENSDVETWYENKIGHLRRSDMLLTISESSRNESIEYLGFPDTVSINISTACDSHFQPKVLDKKLKHDICKRYNLQKSLVMYTGGIDHRKNIEGLIRAYASLSKTIRDKHQLVIVCAIQPNDKKRLMTLAKKHKLTSGELIFTGFVPENDLITLYNLCKVFVFPSWHEGFGLPVLEAMSCGKAVIGSNTSSIPEVIGHENALFEPKDDAAITKKLTQVLTDEKFRVELEQHGIKQAKKFSWDKSANKAIAAFEQLHKKHRQQAHRSHCYVRRPKLAYISPLPPERSGISDYSKELLPELTRHYDIDVIVNQNVVDNPWIKANCQVRTIGWFKSHSAKYERIIYHFGNSDFHQHMFHLLKNFPGIVVLHDFFLSGIIAHMEFTGSIENIWSSELYHSHGYKAVQKRFHKKELSKVIYQYPCNLQILKDAKGIIVHSNNSIQLSNKWYTTKETTSWSHIPLLRVANIKKNTKKSRIHLKFNEDDFIVCSFGLLGPSKLNHRLLDAWLASDLVDNDKCKLIFVGENDKGEYGIELLNKIRNRNLSKRITITGWADAEVFQHYLSAADISVQLRTLSRGETSAAVLDSMNYGLSTIVNSNGSMADLPNDTVYKLPDDFSNTELTEALENLWRDDKHRTHLGNNARKLIQKNHNPRTCANLYYRSIEKFYRNSETDTHALIHEITKIENIPNNSNILAALSESIAFSIPQRYTQKQLFIDVSELVQRDSKSGIQRVVRNILLELINNPPDNVRIEPVYATLDQGYRYARNFTLNFLNCPSNFLTDDLIEYHTGDVFLGLDLQPQIVSVHHNYYQKMRRHGVNVKFVVYDLLCILMPQHFVDGAANGYTRWLEVITECDGVICISNAVEQELKNWVNENKKKRVQNFNITSFHLGADINNSNPTTGLPKNYKIIHSQLSSHPSFVIVGTIEPRKNHDQVLKAFNLLWDSNIDINLVIVGKQGWLVEELINKLNNHKENNKRLFWLNDTSDEYLELIYTTSDCLIAASEGEGFGLPLIEAAQHRLPIIARDIPVFREVAGNHAYYFNNETDPETLAKAIKNWLSLFNSNQHPNSTELPWKTWKQSASQLVDALKINVAPLNKQTAKSGK